MDGGGRKRIETRVLNLKEALEDRYTALLWLRAFLYTLQPSTYIYTYIYMYIHTYIHIYCVPVAQWLDHCVNSAKVVGSIPREHTY